MCFTRPISLGTISSWDAPSWSTMPLHHCRCLVIESKDDFFYFFPRSQGDVSTKETIPPSILSDVLPDQPSR